MKRSRAIALVVLLAAIAVAAFFALRPRELVYQGRPIRAYLDDLVKVLPNDTREHPSMEAIRLSGPIAVPVLRNALRRVDSPMQRFYRAVYPKLPAAIARHMPVPRTDYLKRLRTVALEALIQIGPHAKAAIPELIKCFNDRETMNSAVYAIREIGPEGRDVPALAAILRHEKNMTVRAYAAESLGRIGRTTHEAIAGLVLGLADKEGYVRRRAATSLGDLGTHEMFALEALTLAMCDPDPTVQVAAAFALWRIRCKVEEPLETLIQVLDQVTNADVGHLNQTDLYQHQFTVATAADAVGQIGSPAKAAVPPLEAALKKETVLWVRLPIAAALWHIDQRTDSTIPVLIQALSYHAPYQRSLAAKVLGEIAEEKKPGFFLEEMLSHKDLSVRVYGARAVWKTRGEAAQALPILIDGLKDFRSYYVNRDIREVSAQTLGEVGPAASASIPALLATLHDGESSVRKAASKALIKIDPKWQHKHE